MPPFLEYPKRILVNHMQLTQLSQSQETVLARVLAKYPKVKPIVSRIIAAGGRALLIGGAVRDLLMGLEVKDLDIEVHGLELKQLEKILQESGPVSMVGKSFGVLRVHGLDIDWSLPRSDAAGRKPSVTIDPHMGIKQACARRDLTINAMAIDLSNNQLIDPFGGQAAIKHTLLRSPDIQFFTQDPLRFFRVMQFISRFNMQPDDELNKLCKKMDISAVSRERIEAEFEKMLMRSEYPSRGIRWLKDIGRLKEVLPELYDTIGVQQDPHWHPEGDVFEHTMQTVDAAVRVQYESEEDRLRLLLAALCHDLGKVSTTTTEGKKVKSYGHDMESVELTRQMLKRITGNKERKAAVTKLVRSHMAPVQFVADGAKHNAYKRLALKLAPETNLQMLADLARADKQGRNPASGKPLTGESPEIGQFLEQSIKAAVLMRKEEPVVQGRDLMAFVEPGPQMGELVKRAYEIQLEEGIKDKHALIKRVLGK